MALKSNEPAMSPPDPSAKPPAMSEVLLDEKALQTDFKTQQDANLSSSSASLSRLQADNDKTLESDRAQSPPSTPSSKGPNDGQDNKSERDKTKVEDEDEEEEYTTFTPFTKTYLTYLLGVIMILSTLTATIYFPLIPMLSHSFSVSVQAINLTVTIYAICQAISPALFASLADASGRRPVLLGLIAIYSLASLGLALNRGNYGALVALRALQSIGGSATPPIAYGIVADVAIVSERGAMLGPMLSTCNAISAVGPVIGGAVALGTDGYKWVFLALLMIALSCLVLAGLTLPETSRNVVGNGSRPARGVWRTWWSFVRPTAIMSGGKMMKEKSEEIIPSISKSPITTTSNVSSTIIPTRPKWHPLNAFASLRIVLYPDAALVLWMVSTSYIVYYTFQVAIPIIYADIYGYNELEIGLTFLPGLAGMTIGGIIAGKLVDRNYATTARKYNIDIYDDDDGDKKKKKKLDKETHSRFPLEEARYRHILPFILFETALVAAYGWTVTYKLHASIPLIMQFFICGTSTLLSHTASALLVDIFPDLASSAYASGQIVRCGMSAGSAAVVQPFVDRVGRGWYFVVFAVFVGLSGVGAVGTSTRVGMRWRLKRQGVTGMGMHHSVPTVDRNTNRDRSTTDDRPVVSERTVAVSAEDELEGE